MSKACRIAIPLIAVVVLGSVVWFATPPRQREPVYYGKPLDVWLLGYRSPEPDYRKRAVVIAHQAGTNAIPTLVRMLQAHDPPIKRKVMEFVQTQSSFRIHYISSGIRNAAAANVCEELGEKAQAAVPALVELLTSSDAYVRSAASAALKRVDPDAATKAAVK